MLLQYTSMDRIFAMYNRNIGTINSERDIIEWTGEALEAMSSVKGYEETVAFIEVKNYQCEIPKYTHGIIQIARNNKWTPSNKDCVIPVTIASEVQNVAYTCDKNTGDKGYIVLDCDGMPMVEYDIAYYRPYFDLVGEYYGWSNCKTCRQDYSPVRLSNNSFFNSIVCKEKDQSIYHGCKDEYTIIQGRNIRVSFETGSVAVAYLRQLVDKNTGYPMIPDNFSHLQAIMSYLKMKVADKDFQNNREGAERRLAKAESDWQWYCKQATNAELIPNGIDEHQNLSDQLNYIIPRTNDYFSYFGKLNEAEYRQWNNANLTR